MTRRKFRQGWDGEIPAITHDQLVSRAFDYLRLTLDCKVCFKERVASTSEIPDAIGYCNRTSRLIECKASRADFLKDKKKWFRTHPDYGMGYNRYIMAPVGLLLPKELPEGWGLLEVYKKERGHRAVIVEANPKDFTERNLRAELSYLISAIRRIQISMAVFIEKVSE